MLVHCRVTPSIKFTSTHLYIWVERGIVRVMSGLRPKQDKIQISQSRVKYTNHEATVHPSSLTMLLSIDRIIYDWLKDNRNFSKPMNCHIKWWQNFVWKLWKKFSGIRTNDFKKIFPALPSYKFLRVVQYTQSVIGRQTGDNSWWVATTRHNLSVDDMPVIEHCPPHLYKCLWHHYFRIRNIVTLLSPVYLCLQTIMIHHEPSPFFGNLLYWRPVIPGGYLGFQIKWWGWLNGVKSQDPKKSLGLPANPQKIPGPKIKPQKIPCWFCGPLKFQVISQRNQKFTKATGNSCDGKANWLNWSGWSLVHGQAPRDNADHCITCAI